MSEKALRDLSTIPGSERKIESHNKAPLMKPSVNNDGKKIEERQKKTSCGSFVSPTANGNQTVDSGIEIAIAEVEYIESENLNDLEDIDFCLKVLSYPLFLWVLGPEGLQVVNYWG